MATALRLCAPVVHSFQFLKPPKAKFFTENNFFMAILSISPGGTA